MSDVRFDVDISMPLVYLSHLMVPSHRVTGALEATLTHAFQRTQEEVHVITGSLRGSGRTESDFDGVVWHGEITYGGPSPGFPNDPVEYAGYEQRRGADHDFLRSAPLVMHEVVEVLMGFMSGAI